jgi:hypothetical protein
MKAAAHPAAFYKHDLATLVVLAEHWILERDSSASRSIHRSHISSYASSPELLRTELNFYGCRRSSAQLSSARSPPRTSWNFLGFVHELDSKLLL